MVYGPPGGFVRNKPSVHIDRTFCIGCMKCIGLCRRGDVLKPARDERGLYADVINPLSCIGCGKCLFNCPTHAIGIKMNSRDNTNCHTEMGDGKQRP